ncbi:maleylpyruvate isomerase family mycothiol-dependent enzyme [Kitasatospora sp. NBC_00315]|uniref:maleylpyruvate isomerase family mycothiol-dependent enzyme n=1 Tax=Kitasatospora sp. NBC_00315 TaxID=2975963 RepID=UPI00325332E6
MSENPWDRVPRHLAYRSARESVSGLLAGRSGDSGLAVPACPGWTIRDVVAHLVTVCRHVVDGTEAQLWEIPVEEPGADLAALLADWAALDAGMERRLTEPYSIQHSIMLMDCFSHEIDIRTVLGEPVVDRHPAYPIALDLVALGFGAAVASHGMPALQLEVSGAQWVAGEGEPVASVRGHRHDLYRSLTGRRTVEQIYALDWSGDPDVWLAAFAWGPFQPPDAATEHLVAGGGR